ncbi:unnamed protein product [Amoebophrya sp. A25]|nr:unnamed protein product [Amoebophrya sp. A25]|eukprot:GSA25T00020957001.1
MSNHKGKEAQVEEDEVLLPGQMRCSAEVHKGARVQDLTSTELKHAGTVIQVNKGSGEALVRWDPVVNEEEVEEGVSAAAMQALKVRENLKAAAALGVELKAALDGEGGGPLWGDDEADNRTETWANIDLLELIPDWNFAKNEVQQEALYDKETDYKTIKKELLYGKATNLIGETLIQPSVFTDIRSANARYAGAKYVGTAKREITGRASIPSGSIPSDHLPQNVHEWGRDQKFFGSEEYHKHGFPKSGTADFEIHPQTQKLHHKDFDCIVHNDDGGRKAGLASSDSDAHSEDSIPSSDVLSEAGPHVVTYSVRQKGSKLTSNADSAQQLGPQSTSGATGTGTGEDEDDVFTTHQHKIHKSRTMKSVSFAPTPWLEHDGDKAKLRNEIDAPRSPEMTFKRFRSQLNNDPIIDTRLHHAILKEAHENRLLPRVGYSMRMRPKERARTEEHIDGDNDLASATVTNRHPGGALDVGSAAALGTIAGRGAFASQEEQEARAEAQKMIENKPFDWNSAFYGKKWTKTIEEEKAKEAAKQKAEEAARVSASAPTKVPGGDRAKGPKLDGKTHAPAEHIVEQLHGREVKHETHFQGVLAYLKNNGFNVHHEGPLPDSCAAIIAGGADGANAMNDDGSGNSDAAAAAAAENAKTVERGLGKKPVGIATAGAQAFERRQKSLNDRARAIMTAVARGEITEEQKKDELEKLAMEHEDFEPKSYVRVHPDRTAWDMHKEAEQSFEAFAHIGHVVTEDQDSSSVGDTETFDETQTETVSPGEQTDDAQNINNAKEQESFDPRKSIGAAGGDGSGINNNRRSSSRKSRSPPKVERVVHDVRMARVKRVIDYQGHADNDNWLPPGHRWEHSALDNRLWRHSPVQDHRPLVGAHSGPQIGEADFTKKYDKVAQGHHSFAPENHVAAPHDLGANCFGLFYNDFDQEQGQAQGQSLSRQSRQSQGRGVSFSTGTTSPYDPDDNYDAIPEGGSNEDLLASLRDDDDEEEELKKPKLAHPEVNMDPVMHMPVVVNDEGEHVQLPLFHGGDQNHDEVPPHYTTCSAHQKLHKGRVQAGDNKQQLEKGQLHAHLPPGSRWEMRPHDASQVVNEFRHIQDFLQSCPRTGQHFRHTWEELHESRDRGAVTSNMKNVEATSEVRSAEHTRGPMRWRYERRRKERAGEDRVKGTDLAEVDAARTATDHRGSGLKNRWLHHILKETEKRDHLPLDDEFEPTMVPGLNVAHETHMGSDDEEYEEIDPEKLRRAREAALAAAEAERKRQEEEDAKPKTVAFDFALSQVRLHRRYGGDSYELLAGGIKNIDIKKIDGFAEDPSTTTNKYNKDPHLKPSVFNDHYHVQEELRASTAGSAHSRVFEYRPGLDDPNEAKLESDEHVPISHVDPLVKKRSKHVLSVAEGGKVNGLKRGEMMHHEVFGPGVVFSHRTVEKRIPIPKGEIFREGEEGSSTEEEEFSSSDEVDEEESDDGIATNRSGSQKAPTSRKQASERGTAATDNGNGPLDGAGQELQDGRETQGEEGRSSASSSSRGSTSMSSTTKRNMKKAAKLEKAKKKNTKKLKSVGEIDHTVVDHHILTKHVVRPKHEHRLPVQVSEEELHDAMNRTREQLKKLKAKAAEQGSHVDEEDIRSLTARVNSARMDQLVDKLCPEQRPLGGKRYDPKSGRHLASLEDIHPDDFDDPDFDFPWKMVDTTELQEREMPIYNMPLSTTSSGTTGIGNNAGTEQQASKDQPPRSAFEEGLIGLDVLANREGEPTPFFQLYAEEDKKPKWKAERDEDDAQQPSVWDKVHDGLGIH